MPTPFDNPVRTTFSGLHALHAGYRGGLGFMAGFANLKATSTPGSASGMRRLQGAEVFPFGIPTSTIKPVLGDDTTVDTYEYGNTDVIRALIECGINDDVFNAAAEGMIAKVVGGYTFYGRGDTIGGNRGAFMLLANSQAHNKDSGNLDEAGWRNELFLSSRLKQLGPESIRHQENNKSRLDAVFNNSAVAFWGELLSEAMQTGYRRTIYWYSQYPGMIDCIISEEDQTVIPLSYAPVSAETTKIWDVTADALLTVSSVDVNAKTATVSAAITADGHILQCVYQTPSL
jgi:hypothetical protein